MEQIKDRLVYSSYPTHKEKRKRNDFKPEYARGFGSARV